MYLTTTSNLVWEGNFLLFLEHGFAALTHPDLGLLDLGHLTLRHVIFFSIILELAHLGLLAGDNGGDGGEDGGAEDYPSHGHGELRASRLPSPNWTGPVNPSLY